MGKFKKILHSVVALTTVLWSVGILGLVPASVYAASAVSVASSANFPGYWILASSSATAIAKVTVTASQASQTLTSVTANFSGTGFATSDLASIATGDASGVALYTDHATSGTAGTFDVGTDPVVTLAASPAWTPSTTNITLTPATPVSLTSGVGKAFYVVLKTSGTISDGDIIAVTISASGVVTSDGSGPTTAFAANSFTASINTAQISSVEWFSGSSTLTVMFSKSVQKINVGGNLAASDFTYTDGGGSAQIISSVSHTSGQNFATITMSAGLDAEDIDASPATFRAASAGLVASMEDMAGTDLPTSAVSVSSPLGISTYVISTATSGTSYTSGTPLVTLTARGGVVGSGYTFSANAAADTTELTSAGLSLSSDGKITGTAGTAGNYQFTAKVTDSTTPTALTSSRLFTVMISSSSGGAPPSITKVIPSGGAQSASALSLSVTGANTSFATGSSTVQFLLGGSNDTNIVASSIVASSTTSLSASVAIAAGATTGYRDVKVTTGGPSVILVNAFEVFASGASGLTLLVPSNAASSVQMPPGFSFNPSSDASINTYRLTMKGTADFAGAALWDYAFPKPTDAQNTNGSHCSTSMCGVSYGAGRFEHMRKFRQLIFQ